VPGYRNEADVGLDSNTETFAAVKLTIDTGAGGVPFFLRSGSVSRARSANRGDVQTDSARLYGDETDSIEPNVLVVKIQPDEGIACVSKGKSRAEAAHSSVYMDFNYGTDSRPISARVRAAAADAMRGDQTLFTRWDQSSAPGDRHADSGKWQNTKDSASRTSRGSQPAIAFNSSRLAQAVSLDRRPF